MSVFYYCPLILLLLFRWLMSRCPFLLRLTMDYLLLESTLNQCSCTCLVLDIIWWVHVYVLLLVLLVIIIWSIYCPCFCFLPIQVVSVKKSNFIIQILLLAYGINLICDWSNLVAVALHCSLLVLVSLYICFIVGIINYYECVLCIAYSISCCQGVHF